MKVERYETGARHFGKTQRAARRFNEYLARRRRKKVLAWAGIATAITVIVDLLIWALCFIDRNNGASAAYAIPISNIVIIPLAIVIGSEISEKL